MFKGLNPTLIKTISPFHFQIGIVYITFPPDWILILFDFLFVFLFVFHILRIYFYDTNNHMSFNIFLKYAEKVL